MLKKYILLFVKDEELYRKLYMKEEIESKRIVIIK